MSYAETYSHRIAAKRLKRRREIAKRLKAYGSVFDHRTLFKTRKVYLPTIAPIEHRRKLGIVSRIINYIKSLFI